MIRRLTLDTSGAVTADLPFVPADGQVDGPNGDPVDLLQGPRRALYYVDIGPLDVANSGAIRRVRNINGNAPPHLHRPARRRRPALRPLAVAFSSAGSSDPEGAA